MPPHLKKINQAHLENSRYGQIVTHVEKELQLNGLEAPDGLQINTVSHKTANTDADRPKPTCHHCKKPENYKNWCRLLKKQTKPSDDTQKNPENKNRGANNSIPNNNTNRNKYNNNHKDGKRAEKNPKTVCPTCETNEKTNHSTEKCFYGAHATQPIDRLPSTEDRKGGIRSNKEPVKMTRMKLLKLQAKIQTGKATSSLWSFD